MGIRHVVVYIPLSMWIWIWGCVWLSAPFIRLTLVPVLSCGKAGNVMGNGVSTMFPQDKFTGRVSRLFLTTISLNKNTNPFISISHWYPACFDTNAGTEQQQRHWQASQLPVHLRVRRKRPVAIQNLARQGHFALRDVAERRNPAGHWKQQLINEGCFIDTP